MLWLNEFYIRRMDKGHEIEFEVGVEMLQSLIDRMMPKLY